MRVKALFEVARIPHSRNLAYFTFSSEAILRWFLPLYLDFCDVFDFDCSRERGCGFDDSRAFEEDCVVDVLSGPGRYRCQGRMNPPKRPEWLPGQTHDAKSFQHQLFDGWKEQAP